jgi:predicted ArsR family transcriptional regulator
LRLWVARTCVAKPTDYSDAVSPNLVPWNPKDIRSVAALEDELRRDMYLLIRRARTPLSREDVSRELGISVKLAAFHLDKLVDRGLLKAHFGRPKGRSGPGAGRSSKFYEPADAEVAVSIPGRDYELIGSVLAEALGAGGPQGTRAAIEAARAKGFEIAQKVDRRLAKSKPRPLLAADRRLKALEYEPYRVSGGEIRLKNCPFHGLASQASDVVCPINRGLVEGIVSGLDLSVEQVSHGPSNGDCCVALRSGRSGPNTK